MASQRNGGNGHSSTTAFHHELDDLLASALVVPDVFLYDENADEETKAHAARYQRLCDIVGMLEDGYDKYLQYQADVDLCVSKVMSAPFFRTHKDEMASCILDLVGRATTLPSLLITYDFVLAFGVDEPSIYRTVHDGLNGMARDKITRLVHQIWAGHYAAVAEARMGGASRGQSRHNHDEYHGLIQESERSGGDSSKDWSGAPSDPLVSNNLKTSTGHPVLHRLISFSQVSTAESSNAARTRIHQIKLRDKAVRLFYEVCRVQRLEMSDMRAVDEKFVNHLYELVEETRLHEDEDFNYLLIKLIVALNEQFMVSSISAHQSHQSQRNHNVVMLSLKSRLHVTKTFGENLIFMLNRASSSSDEDLCMQLLVLKLLYLLFTTKETAHYFYTNDLRVLVDVFMRALSDLPEESESLRHTYLRVLHPLLTHTQLCTYPYKRPQIRRLLKSIVQENRYRGDVSVTTRRLVQRCLDAEWSVELDRLESGHIPTVTGAAASETTVTIVQSIGGEEKPQVKEVELAVTPEGLPSHVTQPGTAEGDLAATPASSASSPPSPRQHRGASFSATGSAPTVLSAARFRTNLSARSAPSTPPPPPEEIVTSPTESGEEEAAMALADGLPNHERGAEPSWQSQVVQDVDPGPVIAEDEEATSGAPAEAGQGASLSVLNGGLANHRPVPRRASHNEFRKTSSSSSSSSAIRRPPPAPPVIVTSLDRNGRATPSQRYDGLPRSSSAASLYEEPGQTMPTGEYDWTPSAPRSRHTSNATLPSRTQSSSSSGAATPVNEDRPDDDRMTRSLGNVSFGDSSSPKTPTTPGKQRRRPPAPPSLLASRDSGLSYVSTSSSSSGHNTPGGASDVEIGLARGAESSSLRSASGDTSRSSETFPTIEEAGPTHSHPYDSHAIPSYMVTEFETDHVPALDRPDSEDTYVPASHFSGRRVSYPDALVAESGSLAKGTLHPNVSTGDLGSTTAPPASTGSFAAEQRRRRPPPAPPGFVASSASGGDKPLPPPINRATKSSALAGRSG